MSSELELTVMNFISTTLDHSLPPVTVKYADLKILAQPLGSFFSSTISGFHSLGAKLVDGMTVGEVVGASVVGALVG